MMLDLVEDIKTEKMVQPPKRWRNWWKVLVNVYFQREKEIGKPGDIYVGEFVWPSKEVAEQKAADEIASGFQEVGIHVEEYLGALPDGERP